MENGSFIPNPAFEVKFRGCNPAQIARPPIANPLHFSSEVGGRAKSGAIGFLVFGLKPKARGDAFGLDKKLLQKAGFGLKTIAEVVFLPCIT